jgi:NDP-sugar pyrophosphorylase family protein
LTDARAKPAMPVAGEPMIRRITRWLAGHGVVDVVMNLHHRPETLTRVVGDGSDSGVRVRYSWEQPRVLGSAGGPRHALDLLAAAPFLIVNGDTLTDVDLAALADAHAASGALVTMALVPNREFQRYGGVSVDAIGQVTGFMRRGPASEGSWHFVGVQVVDPSVFASLPAGVPLNTVGGVYDELIGARPGSVRAFRSNAQFWDVGTPGDYLRTSSAFTPSDAEPPHLARVDPSARVTDSFLFDDVAVGPDARLEACFITDGVRVPAGAIYHQSILMQRDGALTTTPFEI